MIRSYIYQKFARSLNNFQLSFQRQSDFLLTAQYKFAFREFPCDEKGTIQCQWYTIIIYNKMGALIFERKAAKVYSHYLDRDNLPALKSQWSPLRLYKLKRMFEQRSRPHPTTHDPVLDSEGFSGMLNQFQEGYREVHKDRLFNLFDTEGEKSMNWSMFLRCLTLCYFSDEDFLSVVLFAMFDSSLRLELGGSELGELLLINSRLMVEEDEVENILDDEIVVATLLNGRQSVGVEEWVERSSEYIDYCKFRKMFSIFEEEEVEKDTANNFTDYNQLFDEESQRYVGYLVAYKWFEAWKTYVQKEYGIEINGFSKNITYVRTIKTLKSIKTKKSIKSLKSYKSFKSTKSIGSVRSRRTADYPRLKQMTDPVDLQSNKTQYNLVAANIGDKPCEIYNNILEGEHIEILMPELIENVDYIIVSEQVWRRLKFIYGAYPQFRRTGEEGIEIYPKCVKMYTAIHKGRIEYDEERICEFSNHMTLEGLVRKTLNLTPQNFQNNALFYKTCSMTKWVRLYELGLKTADLTPQPLIFLAIMSMQEAIEFEAINCKSAQTLQDIHIGDEFLYHDPVEKVTKKAIFMGKVDKKIVVHFKNSSYIYDVCLQQEDFYRRSSLSRRDFKNKLKIEDLRLGGLGFEPGYCFASALVIFLFSNDQLCRSSMSHYQDEPDSLLEHVGFMAHMLSYSPQSSPYVLSELVSRYFAEFEHFQMTFCRMFLQEFVLRIAVEFEETSENPFADYTIGLTQHSTCKSCGDKQTEYHTTRVLDLSVQPQEMKYYEVVYVPFAHSLKGRQIKRYAFTLALGATLGQYREALQRVAELSGVPYMLTEVHGNDIIKNYTNARLDAPLQALMLREEDCIFAYELCFHLDGFVNDHYSNQVGIRFKNIKIGQLLDFEHHRNMKRSIDRRVNRRDLEREKVWTFGQVQDIEVQTYTHKLLIRLEHQQANGEKVSTTLNPQEVNVAPFPSRSHTYAHHYHIRCLNRLYNLVTREMELCGMPLVVVITNWMRLKELQLIVFQQVRHLLSQKYSFKINDELTSSQQEQTVKMTKKQKIKKFRNYLYGSQLPYRIVIVDLEGRCALCCKIQKTVVEPHEEQYLCTGCRLDPELSISWQIRLYRVRVCVDWRAAECIETPYITDHVSVITTRSYRKNCVVSLEDCINKRLMGGDSPFEQYCCIDADLTFSESITQAPKMLLCVFDRMGVSGEGEGGRQINRRLVHFQLDLMTFGKVKYQLIAVLGIQLSRQSRNQWRFVVIVRDGTRWLQYYGQHVKVVKKNVLQRVCAIALHYSRIESQDNPGKKKMEEVKNIGYDMI